MRTSLWCLGSLALAAVTWGVVSSIAFLQTVAEGDGQGGNTSCHARRGCAECVVNGCQWCVSRGCLPPHDTCADSEVRVCPPVLLERFRHRLVHRVVHVGRRTGGPEALLQLHLELASEGFNTTLDTRRKQVGGGVPPFFLAAYGRHRFTSMRTFRSYKAWMGSAAPNDVYLLTETWPCSRSLFTGSRQVTWHLTVQDTLRLTYNPRVASLYIPDPDPSACLAAAHTHYLARSYLNISHRAVLFPYIPAYIAPPLRPPPKEDIVILDGDVVLPEHTLREWESVSGARVVRAVGLSPQRLYELYARSKVAVDLRPPGAERLVYEASLFDCIVIVDAAENGKSALDFPIPEDFRAPSVEAVPRLLRKAVAEYHDIIPSYAPFRAFVRSLPIAFRRQVRRYFSNNIHLEVLTEGAAAGGGAAVATALSFLLFHPFATVSLPPGVPPPKDFLAHHYFLANFRNASATAAYVLKLRAGAVAVSGDLVPALATHLDLHPTCDKVVLPGLGWFGLGEHPTATTGPPFGTDDYVVSGPPNKTYTAVLCDHAVWRRGRAAGVLPHGYAQCE